MTETFHRQANRYNYEAAIRSAFSKGIITLDDKNLIYEYLTEKQARDHIGMLRTNKITSILVNFRRFMTRSYREAGIGDVYAGIMALNTYQRPDGQPYKQNTIHSYIRILKPFFLWMVENDYTDIPEKKLKNIKAPSQDLHTTKPDEILSVQDIKALVSVCRYSRDKALIYSLYESGVRIGELSRTQWKDIVFDKYGAKYYITDKKTKKHRYSRLTLSASYLATWKDDCPDGSPDAVVFTNLQTGKPIEYITVVRLLERLKKAAGLEKKITPHLFRKSRITHMISQNFQESVIKKTMWGNLSTGMFETYVCLAEEDIDNEILDKIGVCKKISSSDRLTPQPCPRCHAVNPPDNEYCRHCGLPLSQEAVASLTEAKASVLENPALLSEILAEIQALQLKKKGT